MERLEPRQLLSAIPAGYTPAQIRQAYGFDQVSFDVGGQRVAGDGAGQTIAIVDAYNTPLVRGILRSFDHTFNIPSRDNQGQFVLTKVCPQGMPEDDAGWSLETCLDVEWAHVIAPQADILLVEAASSSISDLLNAVDYARQQAGVSVISMSWGSDEFSWESQYDSQFTTPAAHLDGNGKAGGITFVCASGDSGAPATWPAVSPNVVSVGGTTLSINSAGDYIGETAWSGSGGGPSLYEQPATRVPDVAYDADPNTGLAVYDPIAYGGQGGWQVVGGTSVGSPQWAALFALADQGRALVGKGSLDGPSQTLKALFAAPAADFHDITTGNNGYPAHAGYDYVTGLGTPVANRLIPYLASA